MAVRLAKHKPKWLHKIAEENREEAGRQAKGRNEFINGYLDFQSIIEDINDKYGTNFCIEDIFNITQEEEEEALDILDGLDDDEDDED